MKGRTRLYSNNLISLQNHDKELRKKLQEEELSGAAIVEKILKDWTGKSKRQSELVRLKKETEEIVII